MKESFGRLRGFFKAAAVLLAAGSIAAGTAIVPSDFEVPVLLANGEVITPPWYVTANGQQVALVESEEDAREVVKKVAQRYKNEETVKIEIEEKTSAREMELQNGDQKPQIMTVEEAAAAIAEKEKLTVRTTEVTCEKEDIDFEEVEEKTDKLFTGQTELKTKGQKGAKLVTKRITLENGQPVKTDILEEEILTEPQAQVVLTGTKENQEQRPAASRGTARGTGKLAAPVSALNVTSGFGPRWGRTHLGVDLGMPTGSSIVAADSGSVIFAGYSGSYGNLVKLDHGNGLVTYYAHCSAIGVKQGQAVEKGEEIAKVGSTGNSTGPHLHFEVRVNGESTDPMNYL